MTNNTKVIYYYPKQAKDAVSQSTKQNIVFPYLRFPVVLSRGCLFTII